MVDWGMITGPNFPWSCAKKKRMTNTCLPVTVPTSSVTLWFHKTVYTSHTVYTGACLSARFYKFVFTWGVIFATTRLLNYNTGPCSNSTNHRDDLLPSEQLHSSLLRNPNKQVGGTLAPMWTFFQLNTYTLAPSPPSPFFRTKHIPKKL